MNTSVCASCGARILWVRFPSGKHSPMDEELTPDGNTMLAPDTGLAQVVSALERQECNRNRATNGLEPAKYFRPHWASCPKAEWYRNFRERLRKKSRDKGDGQEPAQ